MKKPLRVKDPENGHGAPRMGGSLSLLSSKKTKRKRKASDNQKLSGRNTQAYDKPNSLN